MDKNSMSRQNKIQLLKNIEKGTATVEDLDNTPKINFLGFACVREFPSVIYDSTGKTYTNDEIFQIKESLTKGNSTAWIEILNYESVAELHTKFIGRAKHNKQKN